MTNQRQLGLLILAIILLGASLLGYYFYIHPDAPLNRSNSSSTVKAFVSSQTSIQSLNSIVTVPERDIEVFVMQYGAAQDCLSGCFYLSKEGIRNGSKINWATDYVLDNNDSYMFTDEFYEQLKSAYEWERVQWFDFLLAKSPATPMNVIDDLITYAEGAGGYTGIQTAMIENQNVQRDKDLLLRLSKLPGSPDEVKDLINTYLSNFN